MADSVDAGRPWRRIGLMAASALLVVVILAASNSSDNEDLRVGADGPETNLLLQTMHHKISIPSMSDRTKDQELVAIDRALAAERSQNRAAKAEKAVATSALHAVKEVQGQELAEEHASTAAKGTKKQVISKPHAKPERHQDKWGTELKNVKGAFIQQIKEQRVKTVEQLKAEEEEALSKISEIKKSGQKKVDKLMRKEEQAETMVMAEETEHTLKQQMKKVQEEAAARTGELQKKLAAVKDLADKFRGVSGVAKAVNEEISKVDEKAVQKAGAAIHPVSKTQQAIKSHPHAAPSHVGRHTDKKSSRSTGHSTLHRAGKEDHKTDVEVAVGKKMKEISKGRKDEIKQVDALEKEVVQKHASKANKQEDDSDRAAEIRSSPKTALAKSGSSESAIKRTSKQLESTSSPKRAQKSGHQLRDEERKQLKSWVKNPTQDSASSHSALATQRDCTESSCDVSAEDAKTVTNGKEIHMLMELAENGHGESKAKAMAAVKKLQNQIKKDYSQVYTFAHHQEHMFDQVQKDTAAYVSQKVQLKVKDGVENL